MIKRKYFNLILTLVFFFLINWIGSFAQNPDQSQKITSKKTSLRILIIGTSSSKLHLKDGTEITTGVYAEELIEPKDIFEKAGIKVDVATLNGKKPPFDPKSINPERIGKEKAIKYQKEISEDYDINNPLNLNDLQKEDLFKYDAIFIAGGHGVLEDLPNSEQMGRILKWSLNNAGQIISAVCHGPAAFVALKLVGEENTLRNIPMTGFSEEEEQAVNLYGKVPFELESTLKNMGVQYHQTYENFSPYIVTNAKFMTGQNPASSIPLAENISNTLLERLR